MGEIISLGIFIGSYLTTILSFSFVSNPIYYCILLIFSSFSACGFIFMILGFSWYVALFCLVYVGGVYILFIFVSVYNPNAGLVSVSSWWWLLVFFVLMSLLFSSLGFITPLAFEHSHYLCSAFEGLSYCLFCLVMVMGFVCVSVVVNRKDSFYR
uniref:NADH dehydrogenase subunit 6 n=1 Tax=Cyathocotyle prussica TaxID=2067575 RepID=A0A6J3YQB7_9TREM|nr:NADH dehydrogenase subunit 6 [Cyathocotyle prussica]AYH51392.1 NADH dehydrogenase subunit 6 [Cyathocotyle prussica]